MYGLNSFSPERTGTDKGICMIFGAGERVPKERVGRAGFSGMFVRKDEGESVTGDTEAALRDKTDLVIAADGGMDWIREELPELKPDLFIGDMDSVLSDEGEECGEAEETLSVIKLPVEKDDTDMGAAVAIGMERGYKTFFLYGGTGGRWDHTIANLQLLKHISKNGGKGFLIGPKLTAVVVSAEEGKSALVLIRGGNSTESSNGRPFSLFGMGSAEGVTIRSAKYEATNVTLNDDYALGVSNETEDACSMIRFTKGTLLIVGQFLPGDIAFENID